jgi:uncharacterized membrane protein YfcA
MWIIGVLCAIFATGIAVLVFVQDWSARRHGYYRRNDIPFRVAIFAVPAGFVTAGLSLASVLRLSSDNMAFVLTICGLVIALLILYGMFYQEYTRFKQASIRQQPTYPYTGGA